MNRKLLADNAKSATFGRLVWSLRNLFSFHESPATKRGGGGKRFLVPTEVKTGGIPESESR